MVPLQSQCGLEGTPSGHGPDVVVSALHFVEGVAATSIVPVPHGLQDGVGLFLEPFMEAMGGHLVLGARPDLVAVHGGHLGPTTMRPGAHHQASLPLNGEGSHLGSRGIIEQVVGDDAPQRLTDMFGGKEVAQVQLMRPPLAHQLVGQAPPAELVFQVQVRIGYLDVVVADETLLVEC